MPEPAASDHGPVLEVAGLGAGYGKMQVLWDLSLSVSKGETCVLLGANGAGKTTLLKTIMGLLPAWSGSIRLTGRPIEALRADQRARAGIAYMSEQAIFSSLSVAQNLALAGHGMRRGELRQRLEHLYEVFPDLSSRRGVQAGSLSGGQRKMVGLAKTLVADPVLLVLDEPSSGLSPLFVREVIGLLSRARGEERALLVAEQNVGFLEIADSVAVLEGGRMRFRGTTGDFRSDAQLREAFFGLGLD